MTVILYFDDVLLTWAIFICTKRSSRRKIEVIMKAINGYSVSHICDTSYCVTEFNDYSLMILTHLAVFVSELSVIVYHFKATHFVFSGTP